MFQDLRIEVNGRQVNNSFQCYHIQCHLQLLLNMSQDSYSKWTVAGVYPDENTAQLVPNVANGDPAIKERYERFKGGKLVRLYGPILR